SGGRTPRRRREPASALSRPRTLRAHAQDAGNTGRPHFNWTNGLRPGLWVGPFGSVPSGLQTHGSRRRNSALGDVSRVTRRSITLGVCAGGDFLGDIAVTRQELTGPVGGGE